MGKKSKQTTGPSKYAQPYITNAAKTAQQAYQANQGNLENISGTLNSVLGGVAERAGQVNPLVGAAQGYATDVLGGKYLGEGNPYLQGMIDQTGQSVSDRVNAIFSRSGRTGSDRHASGLAQGLANAENALRYQDYGNERQAMTQAAGMAPGLASAEYAGIAPLLALSQQAATTPYLGSQFLTGATSGLMGGYNTTTTQPGLGQMLLNLGAAGAAAFGGGR